MQQIKKELWASGRINLAAGVSTITIYMAYGFLLIYLRDFAPGHEQWAASYGEGRHFEARLAHVHGALFAVLNMLLGILIPTMAAKESFRRWVAILGFAGLLMPLGILAEIYLGASPVFVLLGAMAIFASFVLASVGILFPKLIAK